MRDPWNVFLATFFTLDYAFEEALDPSEGLREYLSDANPFLWKGKGSADPAIWIEFERDYLEHFPSGDAPDSESLAFVRAYLSQQGPYYIGVFPGGDETPFLELFDAETDPTEWTRMLDHLERQARSRTKTSTELNAPLLEAFPELRERFVAYVSELWGMSTGCFLTYEDVFLRRMVEAFAERDEEFLRRAGAFIERLMTSGDERAINVATVGLLEGLKAHVDNGLVRPYLGPVSLREFNDLTF